MPADVISTLEDLDALAPEWDALWRRTPSATPFQSPQWLLPWFPAFGTGGELAVIASRNDAGALTTVAPLYILRDEDSDESLGMFLGTGVSDYLDIIGNDDVLSSLATLNCQMWDLQQLRPSSPLLTAPLPDAFSDNVEDQEPCPVLSLEGAGEELEHIVSTHFRKKIRYYRRAIARNATVTVEGATEENLDALLDALFALHAARWERRGMPGVLGDETTQAFHRDAARRLLKAGALRMYATRRDERIVAVFYGFAHGATVYYYLSGYDPELEKLSIGTLILAHAMEQGVRDGATTFDFLRGAEEYKYAWGATDRMTRRRQLFRS
ncbi:MAG TPA: GNAT family N-acetyltransferase [Thermoanaerobaculia bacterium]|nr:GNAT family N-acetyltransferase [Thermoanaerobaculia bacterium]